MEKQDIGSTRHFKYGIASLSPIKHHILENLIMQKLLLKKKESRNNPKPTESSNLIGKTLLSELLESIEIDSSVYSQNKCDATTDTKGQ